MNKKDGAKLSHIYSAIASTRRTNNIKDKIINIPNLEEPFFSPY